MPLQVLLATVGSAGDVYPVISLGRGLRARGHRPVIIANAHFQPLATGAGLGFIPLGTVEGYEPLVANPDLWHPTRGFQVLVREAIAAYVRPLAQIISGFDPAETVIAASCFLYVRVWPTRSWARPTSPSICSRRSSAPPTRCRPWAAFLLPRMVASLD